MATTEDVKKLAALARVTVSEEELPAFTKELDAIIAYVGQLETLEVPVDLASEKPTLRNVMRKDEEPHAGGAYTELLAAQFPSREGDALSVKQIITHD